MGHLGSLMERAAGLLRIARIAADAEGRGILINEYGLDDTDVAQAVTWTKAADIVHRHVHQMVEQARGDQHGMLVRERSCRHMRCSSL